MPDVEPIWSSLFAKALEGKDVKDLLMNVGSGGGAAAAPAAGGAAAGGAAAAEEAPKEEEKEEGEFISPPRSDCGEVTVGAWLTQICVQRRRSQTKTWASVSSIKRVMVRSQFKKWGGIRHEWNCILRWRLRLV